MRKPPATWPFSRVNSRATYLSCCVPVFRVYPLINFPSSVCHFKRSPLSDNQVQRVDDARVAGREPELEPKIRSRKRSAPTSAPSRASPGSYICSDVYMRRVYFAERNPPMRQYTRLRVAWARFEDSGAADTSGIIEEEEWGPLRCMILVWTRTRTPHRFLTVLCENRVATMGGYVSSIASMSNTAVHSVCRGRKRKYIEECDSESESDYIDRTLQTPKKWDVTFISLFLSLPISLFTPFPLLPLTLSFCSFSLSLSLILCDFIWCVSLTLINIINID